MPRKPDGTYEIEIRDQRLPGKRMVISARTKSAKEYQRRDAAVRQLLAAGELDLIARLRKRNDPLHIADVAKAVFAGRIDDLRLIGDDSATLTLQASIDRLLESTRATSAASTINQYEMACRMLVEKFGGNTALTEITSDMLRKWLHEPKESTGNKPWSGASQSLKAAVIGKIFNMAIDAEAERAEQTKSRARISRNPVKSVALAATNKRVEFLQPAEWLKLSEKCEGRAVHALMGLCTLTGLRQQEACHIRKDIDLIDLTGAKPRIQILPHNGEWAWNPKGYPRHSRSCRTIPIPKQLQEILIAHIASGFCGQVYLLKTPTGPDRPLCHQQATDWTRDAFTAAGIRYGRKMDALTLHSLRHTFISWLIKRNVNLKKIEKLAGTSVKMILDVYGHLIDDDLDEAMALIDEMVGA
jgi:integrase